MAALIPRVEHANDLRPVAAAPHCRKGESPARNLLREVLSTAEAYLIHWNSGYNQGAEVKNDGFAAKQNVVCRRDFGVRGRSPGVRVNMSATQAKLAPLKAVR
jgi:hypothetical protein